MESALVIQRRVRELLGEEVGGWKCSVPSAERPVLAAPIFASTIMRTSPCRIFASSDTALIEPEVAFVMARDLPQRDEPYSEAEIREAIAETRLVLELLGSRYANTAEPTWPEMMADSIQNQGLFVGPIVPGGADASELRAFEVIVAGPKGVLLAHEGRHGDGHPLQPLYWLVNFVAARNEGLRAGQIITTGSYAGAVTVPMDEPLTVTFGDLGAIAITLHRAA